MEFNWKLEEGMINLHMQIGKNIIKIFISRGELMTMYVFIDTNQLSYLGKNTELQVRRLGSSPAADQISPFHPSET